MIIYLKNNDGEVRLFESSEIFQLEKKLKEPNANSFILHYNTLPKDIRDEWIIATAQEIDDYKLKEAKASKIYQLKLNRDNANLKPLVSVQAEEIIVDENQQETETGNNVYFTFSTKSTGQPATDPSTIILSTLLMASADPTFYTRYSCKIIEGDYLRSGYVKLDPAVAINIQSHIKDRNISNIHHCNVVEELIKEASTIEEVEAINIIDFS